MSRIGKKPVEIINGVQIKKHDDVIEVKGPKGTLSMAITGGINVDVKDNEVIFTRINDYKKNKSLHGLYRALLNNLVLGVTQGYSKKLELVGIGYKAELKGDKLVLLLGYSHPIVFVAPSEVKIEVPSPTSIIING
ncbi:MAG: 50S ribosomal protein L6, partial [Ignavibacteria bacterium]